MRIRNFVGALIAMLSLGAGAQTVSVDKIQYQLNDDGTASVGRQLESLRGYVTLPDTIEHDGTPYRVTAMLDSAFYKGAITGIFIPESLTSIGTHCFSYCGGLVSIDVDEANPVYHSEYDNLIHTATETLIRGGRNTMNVPDVKALGDYCFMGCDFRMSTISIPSCVATIGEGCFEGSDITFVYIMGTEIALGNRCFANARQLHQIVLYNIDTPFDYPEDAFDGVNTAEVELVLPSTSALLFKRDARWKCFHVVAISAYKADANCDDMVDITDINILINIMLGKMSTDDYYCQLIDYNDLDVDDINLAIDESMGKPTDFPTGAPRE